jgi:hypothetical protein
VEYDMHQCSAHGDILLCTRCQALALEQLLPGSLEESTWRAMSLDLIGAKLTYRRFAERCTCGKALSCVACIRQALSTCLAS